MAAKVGAEYQLNKSPPRLRHSLLLARTGHVEAAYNFLGPISRRAAATILRNF